MLFVVPIFVEIISGTIVQVLCVRLVTVAENRAEARTVNWLCSSFACKVL